MTHVADWLERTADRWPDHVSVSTSGGEEIRYGALSEIAGTTATLLRAAGIGAGTCVVVVMRKAIDTLIAFHAVARAGATYVPADALGPMRRVAVIARDCEAAAVIADAEVSEPLSAELDAVNCRTALLCVPGHRPADGEWPIQGLAMRRPGPARPAIVVPADTAFMLYTSGSTGTPKAVRVTHENVRAFIDWASTWVRPTPGDRFAAHAPLHFSLSVFNIYLPWKHAAAIVLFDEQAGRVPGLLAPAIERTRVSVWFSTPTILAWLAQSGLLPALDLAALRLVIFSGEAFPTSMLQLLTSQVPAPAYVHVLGSTETHMMARYAILPGAALPARLPVGRVAAHFRWRIVDEQLNDVAAGADGELCLSGPGVTPEYWRRPAETAAAFFTDATGERWYRTRDIVRLQPDGDLMHRGRRDRMIKKRGNRVELGDIETCLSAHADVREVAVVAADDARRGMVVMAFVVPRPGGQPTVVGLKAHCAKSLAPYMVPDAFAFAQCLPRTPNGKVDFPHLQTLVQARHGGRDAEP